MQFSPAAGRARASGLRRPSASTGSVVAGILTAKSSGVPLPRPLPALPAIASSAVASASGTAAPRLPVHPTARPAPSPAPTPSGSARPIAAVTQVPGSSSASAAAAAVPKPARPAKAGGANGSSTAAPASASGAVASGSSASASSASSERVVLKTTASVIAAEREDAGPAPRKRKKIYDSDEDWSGKNRRGRRKKKLDPPPPSEHTPTPAPVPAPAATAAATTAATASAAAPAASRPTGAAPVRLKPIPEDAGAPATGKPQPKAGAPSDRKANAKAAAAAPDSAAAAAAKPKAKPKPKPKAAAKAKADAPVRKRKRIGFGSDDSEPSEDEPEASDADADTGTARAGAGGGGADAAGGGGRASARLRQRLEQQAVAPPDYQQLTPPEDPLALLECEWYRTKAEQPFGVTIDTNVVLVMDVHAHLASTEVIGLLAGTWDGARRALHVVDAFPCASLDTGDNERNVEMDPASEIDISRIIASRGLLTVGWYHSHPTFPNNPSVTDVHNHSARQRLVQDAATGLPPYVAAIISPFDSSNHTPPTAAAAAGSESQSQSQSQDDGSSFGVDDDGVGLAIAPTKWFACRGDRKQHHRTRDTPIELWSALQPSQSVPPELLTRLTDLVRRYADCQTRTNFAERYRIPRDTPTERFLSLFRSILQMPTPLLNAKPTATAGGATNSAASASASASTSGSGAGGLATNGLSALAAAATSASATLRPPTGSTPLFPPPSPLLGLSVAVSTPQTVPRTGLLSVPIPHASPSVAALSPLAPASPWLVDATPALGPKSAATAIPAPPSGVLKSAPTGAAAPSPLATATATASASAVVVPWATPSVGPAAAPSSPLPKASPAKVSVPPLPASSTGGLGSPISDDSMPLRMLSRAAAKPASASSAVVSRPFSCSPPAIKPKRAGSASGAGAGSSHSALSGLNFGSNSSVMNVSKLQKWQLSVYAHLPPSAALTLDAQLALVREITEPVLKWQAP